EHDVWRSSIGLDQLRQSDAAEQLECLECLGLQLQLPGAHDRVNYARNVYDSTLDRSYEYDQVGALVFAHSGAEARAAFGIDGQQWGTSDGPYSHMYDYDKHGNMTHRYGWGGEVQQGTAGQN